MANEELEILRLATQDMIFDISVCLYVLVFTILKTGLQRNIPVFEFLW